MKLKICLLLLILSVGYESLANAIIDRSLPNRNSAINKSSIVHSSIFEDKIQEQDYESIINDLNNQINENPEEYSLYVSLIEAYIKNKNYNEAYDKLLFLKYMKDQDKLSDENNEEIKKLYFNISKYSKYLRQKSSIYVELALLAILNDNYIAAENYIKNSVKNVTNQDIVINGINIVFENTQNYIDAVSTYNLFLSLNKANTNEVKKHKIYFLLKSNNLNAALYEYSDLLQNNDDLYSYQKYELLKAMIESNINDKKIYETFYKNKDGSLLNFYFEAYNLLEENKNNDLAKHYADKIVKEFPDSTSAEFIKAINLINQGKNIEAYNILNSLRNRISAEDEINLFNRLLVLISGDNFSEVLGLLDQGYYKQAIEILNSKNIIESELTLALKAKCYIELNQMKKALECLNKGLTYNPNYYLLNLNFAEYYQRNDNCELARKYAEKAYNLSINDIQRDVSQSVINSINEIEAGTYTNKINSALDSQNYEEAMRLIDEALSIDPNSSELYFYKGLCNIAQSNYAESTAALYKSIELDENNVLAHFYLGVAFDNLSEEQNALNYYERFLQLLAVDEYQETEKAEYARARIQKIKKIK